MKKTSNVYTFFVVKYQYFLLAVYVKLNPKRYKGFLFYSHAIIDHFLSFKPSSFSQEASLKSFT